MHTNHRRQLTARMLRALAQQCRIPDWKDRPIEELRRLVPQAKRPAHAQ